MPLLDVLPYTNRVFYNTEMPGSEKLTAFEHAYNKTHSRWMDVIWTVSNPNEYATLELEMAELDPGIKAVIAQYQPPAGSTFIYIRDNATNTLSIQFQNGVSHQLSELTLTAVSEKVLISDILVLAQDVKLQFVTLFLQDENGMTMQSVANFMLPNVTDSTRSGGSTITTSWGCDGDKKPD